MIKWLCKNTAEYRLESLSDVEQFHKDLQKACEYEDYNLTAFSWTEKATKVDGDVESWFLVKATYVFNVPKDPEFPYNSVSFGKATLTDAEIAQKDEEQSW